MTVCDDKLCIVCYNRMRGIKSYKTTTKRDVCYECLKMAEEILMELNGFEPEPPKHTD